MNCQNRTALSRQFAELIMGQARLPRLIRVEASNTAGRVHQLQAFFLFLRGRHYTFVYLAA
jgi:hypothetical protein